MEPDNISNQFDIERILKEPEFSFLIRYYSLLYQTLIPNSKLTISILKQHLKIPSWIEDYILDGEEGNRRKKCQRVLNFLIVELNSQRDYMQFCYLLNLISIMTDLPYRLIREFHCNGKWDKNVPAHPGLQIHRCSNNTNIINPVHKVDDNTSNNVKRDEAISPCDDDDKGASDNKAKRYCISDYYQIYTRRLLVTTNNKPRCQGTAHSYISVLGYDDSMLPSSSSSSSNAADKISRQEITTTAAYITYRGLNGRTSILVHIDVANKMECFSFYQASNENMVSTDQLPQILILNKDLSHFKTQYHNILQLMPDDYEPTIEKLQNYLNDDQICAILCSSNYTIANKLILDSLIEKMSCREDLLDLCDRLQIISQSQDLNTVINDIRYGVEELIQVSYNTSATQNTSISANPNMMFKADQQSSISTNPSSPFYQQIFSQIPLHPSSKVLAILKENYANLCNCLPHDYMKVIDKIREIMSTHENTLSRWTMLPTPQLINEAIICSLLTLVKSDDKVLVFCELMSQLVDSPTSKEFIAALKIEFLQTLGLPLTSSVILSTGSTKFHPTSNPSPRKISSSSATNVEQSLQSQTEILPLKTQLKKKIWHEEQRLQKGFEYRDPPPFPQNYINRQMLLDDITNKLLNAANDSKSYEVTVAITGAGGFGKTTIVTALCHHPPIKEKFTDGFLFIELGPKSSDPCIKLSQQYHYLTGNALKQNDINHAEQEIHQLTKNYCNLLVIIDDVWHIKDAESLVKAFRRCKIVLTSRMNNITDCISYKEHVTVGPMNQEEARTLLIHKVMNMDHLSQEDKNNVDQIAEDVHLWPLLLFLVRGQLLHKIKHYHSSYQEAIKNVQAKLREKGLTAFDKNTMGSSNLSASRKYAVKACIEATLELLTESQSDKLKSLLIYTGIGVSLPVAVLNKLWNISLEQAEINVDVYWAHGLIQLIDVTIPPTHNIQVSVQVHAVISQFIIENMDTEQVVKLSPYGRLNTYGLVNEALILSFQQLFGKNLSFLSATDYLNYKLSEIENAVLSCNLKIISMCAITDPHSALLVIKRMEEALTGHHKLNVLSMFAEELNVVKEDCHKILKDAHKVSKKLNQSVQQHLYYKNYDDLIQSIELYNRNCSIGHIASNGASIVKKITVNCDKELLQYINLCHQGLTVLTPDYHYISMFLLPCMKMYVKLYKEIENVLQTGSPSHIKQMQNYIISKKFFEELKLLEANRWIKLREIAPQFVP